MHPSLNDEFKIPPPLEPKKVMGRNEPCWCGSEKKWKKCHRDRHLQPEVPIGKIHNDILRHFKTGICLHPEASPENCSNRLINAHTIQRAGGLRAIAENGEVISAKRGYENIFKNNGELLPEPFGIGKASTFLGFCKTHDNKLFEPIENNSFMLNHEAAFLLSFRAISYEYLAKQNAIKTLDVRREMDKGKNFELQVAIQQNLHIDHKGLIRGFQEIKNWKAEYDKNYITRNYLSMPHYAIEFDDILPFVCSGAFHPEVDFDGRRLQIITRGEAPTEHVCVNVSVLGSKSFLVFGWYGNPNGPAEQFVKSFKSMDKADTANSCLIMAVEQLENTYFKPSWWNSIEQSDKRHLIKRMQSGTGSNSVRFSNIYQNIKSIIKSVSVAKEICNF